MAAIEPQYASVTEVRSLPGVLVLDFYKDDCGPCNLLAPVMDTLAREFKDQIIVMKLNVDKHPHLALSYGVQAFPTVFIQKNGEIKHFFAGRKPAAVIRQMIEETL
jgi:thioredoxin